MDIHVTTMQDRLKGLILQFHKQNLSHDIWETSRLKILCSTKAELKNLLLRKKHLRKLLLLMPLSKFGGSFRVFGSRLQFYGQIPPLRLISGLKTCVLQCLVCRVPPLRWILGLSSQVLDLGSPSANIPCKRWSSHSYIIILFDESFKKRLNGKRNLF